MFRKLMVLGVVTGFLGVLATPAHAAGHVRQYTPSRTATVHTASDVKVKKLHHAAKLVKDKKHKHGKKKHGKKK